ncbi:hypothetical protein GCM10022209_51020 [Chitinophaga oryziterrae]
MAFFRLFAVDKDYEAITTTVTKHICRDTSACTGILKNASTGKNRNQYQQRQAIPGRAYL